LIEHPSDSNLSDSHLQSSDVVHPVEPEHKVPEGSNEELLQSASNRAHELHANAVQMFSQGGPSNKESAKRALDLIEQSINIQASAQSIVNAAKICMVLEDHQKAIFWAEKCLEFCKQAQEIPSLELHRILGQAHAHLAQYKEALTHLQTFYAQNAQDMANEFDLSYALLALGNYEEGWHHYQVRYRSGFSVSGAKELAKIPATEWDGNLDSLHGKVFLLMPEQGFGDEIQFSRICRHLQSAGARVWVMAPKPLETLMRTLPWKERVVGTDWQGFSEVDCWSTAIRSCALLKLNPYKEPPCCPYFLPDPGLVSSLQNYIQQGANGANIGLNWRGNPQHFNDKARSLSLEEMLQELRVHLNHMNLLNHSPTAEQTSPAMGQTHKGQKQTSLYSFQISPTSEEIELMAIHGIRNLASEIKDFSIMAAALSMMDHMISVDSAPAHLAGALNVPTTLLVPPRIDWRWGTKEQRPPWYSSVQVKEQMRFK
jgi:hypothetical protein